MVSKNGMWRSVTLTPGELELKKHRDLLERVNTAHSTVTLDSKVRGACVQSTTCSTAV